MFSFSKINRDISYVALYRVFQVGSVGLTTIFIPLFLNEIEQGIYFVFLNLIAAQLLFELGLNQAVIQVSSNIQDRNTNDYKDLIEWLNYIYKRIAIKFYIIVSFFGALYFYLFSPLEYLYVIYYWLMIAVFVSLNLSLIYRYALLESENKVSLSYRGKIIPLLLSTLSIWTLLCMGYALISIVFGYAIQTLITFIWIKKNYPSIINETNKIENNKLYIMQIRMIKNKFALSYIGGYISFNSIVPVVYAFISPTDAGRVGLSLALFSAVTLVASSFVTAKNASFVKLISTSRFEELNESFKRYYWLSLGSAFFLAILVFTIIAFMNDQGYNFSARLMDVNDLIAIAIAACVNTAIYAMAIYVRSHKVEPFVASSLVTALITILLVLFGVKHSVSWTVYGYVVSVLLVSLPWAIFIFLPYYKKNINKL